MFGNLRAEMARNKMTGTDMANVLHITHQSFYKKMSGETDFTLSQMRMIQLHLKAVNPSEKENYTLDYLFTP
jgi:hypothetical protein